MTKYSKEGSNEAVTNKYWKGIYAGFRVNMDDSFHVIHAARF